MTLCVVLKTQNYDWLFYGNLSTSVKNTPAAINTRHKQNKQLRAEQIFLVTAQNKQQSRVAFVEETKHKANPVTDEVRAETRNHGLA